MRLAPIALAAGLALPLPVNADCAGEIAALFTGGALDPFVRPNRRETTVVRHPDGSETPASDVLWDGVTRSINCYPGGCSMIVGDTAWLGQSFDGPWTVSPSQLPENPEAFARAIADDMGANVSDVDCPGVSPLEGRDVTVYRYRTRTNPNEFGSWFGGAYTASVAVESGLLERLEEAESISSWAPDPSPDVRVTTIVYDDSISISRPEE